MRKSIYNVPDYFSKAAEDKQQKNFQVDEDHNNKLGSGSVQSESLVKPDKKEKKEKKDKKKRQADGESGQVQNAKKLKSTDTTTNASSSSSSLLPVVPSVTNSATADEVSKFLETSEITITDPRTDSVKPPVLSFDNLNIDNRVLSFLTSKYDKPTPIQSASWPFLIDGRDLIGVAETGSGKTMAFAVPAIAYLLSLSSSSTMKPKNNQTSVLIISPTRELAIQIHDNLQDLGSAVGIKSVCVYGGVSKDDQKRELKNASIVVATPGRLIDLVNDGAIKLQQVSYLVLDEADRMLEKGFEEDIKRIINETDRAIRRTVMFTATWPPSVRDLAAEFLTAPVKVMIGDRESELKANNRIEQVVEVMDPLKKETRLLQLLKQYQSGPSKNDKILIFALYKKEASRVERFLQNKGYHISAIHGDLSQVQRTTALESFKKGDTKLLLATDVAARGLDIPAVKLVINLTFPLTAEDYVHRIGRTGRAGQTGKAITFFTEHEKHLSGALINVLRAADQPVPEELLKFGGHTKKKEHSAYGAFYKDVDTTKKAKKIVFD
ncbi:P-loop containing nucleoside triphosphate hydrolase protein [Lipomyces japonicus]|uniref:P-loop containing nucleoside triphosphate hydrolase protein n=1 Tax=Lipomyces japonicus TaxID=56871 RepID=UPI0034CF4DF0